MQQGEKKAKLNNWCAHNDKMMFLYFYRKDYLPLGTFTVVQTISPSLENLKMVLM